MNKSDSWIFIPFFTGMSYILVMRTKPVPNFFSRPGRSAGAAGLRLHTFTRGIGLAVLAVACSFTTGCASSDPNGHTAYSGYQGGAGMSSQNVQANSPLPGPRYYQSSDEPFHQN